jgi:prophage regulatory protein
VLAFLTTAMTGGEGSMMSHHSSHKRLVANTSTRNAYQQAKDGEDAVTSYQSPNPQPVNAPTEPTPSAPICVTPSAECSELSSKKKSGVLLIPSDDLFLSDHDVARRYSVTKQTIWRWHKILPGFPKPIKIGGASRWRLSELIAYEAQYVGYSTDKRSAK